MTEFLSILDVVKRGGYEASLTTTFNSALPFYEEVLLRKLVSAGSRYNVVLMDGAQCAQAWQSEAMRPRLAGHSYTLLPMKMAGAFHPKICLLAGRRKASLLIGSHNLTLSGFGFNREITNWIEVTGASDSDGVTALVDSWSLVQGWIERQRPHLPAAIIESALAIARFVSPLIQKSKASGGSGVLGQSPGGPGLLDQLAARVPEGVRRIVAMGAFFDGRCEFLRSLEQRWPQAQIAALIDPETVDLNADMTGLRTRFVNARQAWGGTQFGYLHAKAIYFETDTGALLSSGSANPSLPAWTTAVPNSNVEAIFVRDGEAARATAQALGLTRAFECDALDVAALQLVVERSAARRTKAEVSAESMCVAVADDDLGTIVVPLPDGCTAISVASCGPDIETAVPAHFEVEDSGQLRVSVERPVSRVRSLLVQLTDGFVLRALVHHPAALGALGQSQRQVVMREALGSLGSGEGNVAQLIAIVEKVIFSDDVGDEVRGSRHAGSGGGDIQAPVRPQSLGIAIADLPTARQKRRLLRSGDLAYLLDILIRRLGLEFEEPAEGRDGHGRSEEESIGQDDDDQNKPPMSNSERLDDEEVAEMVARKAHTLVKRMCAQLQLAAEDGERTGAAIAQLVAVLGLLRELRRLRLAPRWRSRASLVKEADRRLLLEKSMAWLFGRQSMALPRIAESAEGPLEEVGHLRALLLWLAWDLGEELTDRIAPLLEISEAQRRLRANAVLYELLPGTVVDPDESAMLASSIRMTVTPTGEEGTRASAWLERHLSVGRLIAGVDEKDVCGDGSPALGALTLVPGAQPPRRRVVTALSADEFSVWEFDETRSFMRKPNLRAT